MSKTVITNYARRDSDTTPEYFNNYFKQQINVSENANDAIFSFFEKITDNKESAIALANAVIYTSRSQGMDPMVTLDQFAKLEKTQLSSYICMFLNFNRIGTSLLGINNQPIQNKYIERSILP